MKNSPIRLGVIGAGAAFRTLHWPVLEKQRDEIRVVALANGTRETAEQAAALVGGARIYDDYRDLLRDPAVDAVLVAVPIERIGSILIDAIRSQKHVLSEKPLAATVREGADVLQTCLESDAVIAVAENARYRSDLAKSRELLQARKIGDVFAFHMRIYFDLDAETRNVWTERQWRRDARHPGGFVLDAGVHAVAYLRDLLGEISELDSLVLNRHPVVGGYDTFMMQLSLASGAAGQLFACYTAKVAREVPLEWIVFGSTGSLQLTGDQLILSQWPDGRSTAFTVDGDRGYSAQWRNFCGAIRGEEAIRSTPQMAHGDLVVIDAALNSARTKLRTDIPSELGLLTR